MEEQWTRKDTEICIKAEKSGMAFNPKTNSPLTLDELDKLATKYDKVRSSVTVDEFFSENLISKPFEF